MKKEILLRKLMKLTELTPKQKPLISRKSYGYSLAKDLINGVPFIRPVFERKIGVYKVSHVFDVTEDIEKVLTVLGIEYLLQEGKISITSKIK